MKLLRFSRIQIEPVRNLPALLTVKFLDDQGDYYSWGPGWADVEQLFLKAINTEAFNKPESEWLNNFAKTVQQVSESAVQPVQDAYKVFGTFSRLKGGKLQIISEVFDSRDNFIREDETEIRPLFAITSEFLDHWLGRYVEVLVINEVAVHMRLNDGSGDVYPGP